MGGDDGFLKRWSQRKRDADRPDREEADAPDADTHDAQADEIGIEDDGTLSESELAERLGLPDPAGLMAGDDFKAFLAAGVPGRLRNAALRRLWRSDPGLANLDGLVDYADDYTAGGGRAVATTYEVGKGLRKHLEALDARRGGGDGDDIAQPIADMPGEPASRPEGEGEAVAAGPPEVAGPPPQESNPDAAQAGDDATPGERSAGDDGPPRRRHMVFRRADTGRH